MLITINQTIDPAILDQELDDGLGTFKAITTLRSFGYKTLRDLIVDGGANIARCQGIGLRTVNQIAQWVEAKNLPWVHWGGVSLTELILCSQTANYEVSLEGVEKLTEDSLTRFLEYPRYPRETQASVPIIQEGGSMIGTIKITVKVEFG